MVVNIRPPVSHERTKQRFVCIVTYNWTNLVTNFHKIETQRITPTKKEHQNYTQVMVSFSHPRQNFKIYFIDQRGNMQLFDTGK